MYQHRTTLGAGIATALTTFALAACGDSYSAPGRRHQAGAASRSTRSAPGAGRITG